MTTRSPLNPDPAELGDAWRTMVEAEYEQVERLREWQDPQGDHYAPIAHHFAEDPHRTGDELLDLLRGMSRPDATWLDIGAGGGRYALPLTLVSRQVIAVEPSEGMRGVLRAGMEQHGIENIDIRAGRWPEEADDVSADLSLVAHVGYDIRDINGFTDAIEHATRERCCVVLMDRAPSSGFTWLWEQVHGEPRHQLPGMREYLHLLLARGATPEVRIVPRVLGPTTPEDIREMARRRLWLAEGSEKDRRLQALLDDVLASGADDFQFPSLIALITWTPDRKQGRYR
jgi:SAM-dependent methyltransferase